MACSLPYKSLHISKKIREKLTNFIIVKVIRIFYFFGELLIKHEIWLEVALACAD